ncbi:MAG: amino acid permease [Pseudomonadota bacterium]
MKNAMNGNGLSREIGLFSATVLVIANMVGTGIFTTSGFIMAELGNPRALLLCWFCGGLFALCGALCYGELGARFPRAGGEYVFLRESFGKPVGFLSGWISLIVGFSAPIAAAAIAFAGYFFQAFSLPAGEKIVWGLFGMPLITVSPPTVVAIGVICLFTLVHYHSLRMGSRVQNLLTLFKVALVVVFLIAGFCLGHGSFDHLQTVKALSTPLSAEKFAIALIFVSFAYSGWNAAAYLGSEIIDPKRNIPRALFIGAAVVTLLYLLLNLIYIYAVSPGEMSGVMEIGATAAIHLFGGHVSRIFSGAVALGILSVLSAMVMTGPRIYYAMSKDGVFFPIFGKLNSTRKTPASSIFLQAAIAVVMVLSASFETLLIYIGFTLSLFASLTVIGLMRIRSRSSDAEKGYKTWGYPVTPLVFIGCNLWIILFSIKSRPVTALIGLGTIGVGILVYAFFQRKQSVRSGVVSLEAVNSER